MSARELQDFLFSCRNVVKEVGLDRGEEKQKHEERRASNDLVRNLYQENLHLGIPEPSPHTGQRV